MTSIPHITRPSLRIPWLDLETTTLYPWDECATEVIEAAACVTDERLNIIECYDTVIQPNEPIRWYTDVPKVVLDMHTKSGLRHAVERGDGVPYGEAMTNIKALFQRHGCEGSPLAGSTITFDRTWLRNGPLSGRALDSFLHYRTIDVSSLKAIWQAWYPDVMEGMPAKRDLHRGMADLQDSINLLRWFMARVERGVFPLFSPGQFENPDHWDSVAG